MAPRFQRIHTLPIEPLKSSRAMRLCISLIDLTPNIYIDTKARITNIKVKEKGDELGKRPYVFGIAEDSTFRAPLVCYKPYCSFFQDNIFKFQNAYVHEFEDGNFLLTLAEYNRIECLPEKDPKDNIWIPKIGEITSSRRYCRITLKGNIPTVYPSSRLVKRCDKCNMLIFNDYCSSRHQGEDARKNREGT